MNPSNSPNKAAPSSGLPTTDATAISWWAETADGACEVKDLVIVRTRDGSAAIREKGVLDPEETEIIAIPHSSVQEPAARRAMIGYHLKEAPGTWHELDEYKKAPCDAFFVTQSAARKFVYPYYEAHRLLTKEQSDALKQPFGPNVLGIGHYPPSHSERIGRDFEPAVVLRQGKGDAIIVQGLRAYAESLVQEAVAKRRK